VEEERSGEVVGGVRSDGVGGLEFKPVRFRFIRFLGAEVAGGGGVDQAAVID